jgi:hypothetical protein
MVTPQNCVCSKKSAVRKISYGVVQQYYMQTQTQTVSCYESSCSAMKGVSTCDNQLACVPLSSQQRQAVKYYEGPGNLCGCHAGYGGEAGKRSCTACVAGKYKSAAGDADCTDCGAGTYAIATGQTTCTPCVVGKYGAAGATAESKCMVCPVGKFGGREGAATCAECEPGRVSDGGEGPCRSVTVAGYVIKLVLSLPISITQIDFTEDKQSKYRVSIAAAAGAKPADVTIDKIEAMSRRAGRRLLSESVLVYSVIKASDAKTADTMASSLTTNKINGAMENAGLPKVTIKQGPTVESTAASVNITAPLTGGIVGGLVLLIVLVTGALEFRKYLAKKKDLETAKKALEAALFAKDKARREYNARFDTLDTDRDGYISEAEFEQSLLDTYKVSSIRKNEDSPSAPFKFLVENTSELMSRRQYEQGFEIVEAFQDFEAGKAEPLCLLLRAKQKQKRSQTKAKLKSNLGQVHPIPVPQASQTPKFGGAIKIAVASSAVSAKGLRSAVGLEEEDVLVNMNKDPDLTIECEILVVGDQDDIDNFYSVKDGTSGKSEDIPDHVKHSFQKGYYHGGPITESEYDTNNTGKKLADFHKHEFSVLACLKMWHVLVLRLYTSSSYKLFNNPLRSLLTVGLKWKEVGSEKPSVGTEIKNDALAAALETQVEFTKDEWDKFQVADLSSDSYIRAGDCYFKLKTNISHHPLRFTVYVLTDGIKKLRAVEAKQNPVSYNTPMDLWRGMSNMEVDAEEKFLSEGGTEMAVMSTTSDKKVALHYSRGQSGQSPLVFKYKMTFGLSKGVLIQFLSLYPKEIEYVYPVLFQTSL